MRDGREGGREKERGKNETDSSSLSYGLAADTNLPYPTFSSFHKMAHTSHQKDQCPWSWAAEKRDMRSG